MQSDRDRLDAFIRYVDDVGYYVDLMVDVPDSPAGRTPVHLSNGDVSAGLHLRLTADGASQFAELLHAHAEAVREATWRRSNLGRN